MEIYFYIAQKTISISYSDIIYPNKHDPTFFFNVYKNISTRNNESHYFDVYDMIYSIFYLSIHNNFTLPKAKLRTLQKVLENSFHSNEFKESYFNLFTKIQKHYFALLRFCYICKYKQSKIQVDTDLSLNTIDLNKPNKNVFILFQNQHRYAFLMRDLIHIIENAISNATLFSVSPMQPKNPYTNIPFNLSTLYNIYFKHKESNSVFSKLFHLFFMCRFNRDEFALCNEEILREFSVSKHLQNASVEHLSAAIISMMKDHFYTNRLAIHEDFPPKLLVSIMHPYLYCKYMYKYGITGLDKTTVYKYVLFLKLKSFYEFNKLFGRKIYRSILKNGKREWISEFNTKHNQFRLNEIMRYARFEDDD